MKKLMLAGLIIVALVISFMNHNDSMLDDYPPQFSEPIIYV